MKSSYICRSPSMYKAVIFDFFDVVHRDHQKAWFGRHGFERTGEFAEASNLLDMGSIGYDEYVGRLAEASGQDAEQIRQQFDEFADLNEDTVRIIHELRQENCMTGLLSNSNTDEIRPILDRHGLEPIFDEIIISGEARVAKPDPAVFRLMLNRLGLQPEECVFTDDNLSYIAGAALLNIRTIHFVGASQLRGALTSTGLLSPEQHESSAVTTNRQAQFCISNSL